MKIEIGESVCYSFLRHVKQCWLVQTNWKTSESWPKRKTDEELERTFVHLKERFDTGGSVFKGTKDCVQLLKQGEIDVVGVELDGSVHAMEVAFHDAGLNYTGGVADRVLKKLLRTMLVLDAYHADNTSKHIYFVSPRVYPRVQSSLEETFNRLRAEYPDIDWQLITNEGFASHLLSPTLAKSATTADTSELFVRSAKLLELSGMTDKGNDGLHPDPIKKVPETLDVPTRTDPAQPRQIQPLVRSLMTTILEDFPELLSKRDLRNMMDPGYCRHGLGLVLGYETWGNSLLRSREQGKLGNDGRPRYYNKLYADQYYVCSQWWRSDHLHNAESLLRLIEKLIARRAGRPGIAKLEEHRTEFHDYLYRCSSE